MSNNLTDRCYALLSQLNLIAADTKINVVPLTGGVASDIACIEADNQKWCVKFALPKLKVEADWFAPTHRNIAEYNWLCFAAEIVPQNAVQLFGYSDALQGFAMAYLSADDVYLYKAALLAGKDTGSEAGKIASVLGKIHLASSRDDFDASPFQNQDDFWALRIEPYLCYTASHHPDISDILLEEAERLYRSDTVLIHGDVSPKNIFFRHAEPVILDAECATMGDPCFDISFFLNHLILKAIHMPHRRQANLRAVGDFWQVYAHYICWEDVMVLEQRICQLVPALMLGRVDGKSPVEYLSLSEQETTRKLALKLIKTPHANLKELCNTLDSILS